MDQQQKIAAAIDLLQQAVRSYGRAVYASSLGSESVVLTDLKMTGMDGMGDPDPAVDLVMRAVDIDADTADISAGAVAFLIEAGRYRDAVDAFHRGLGANLSDFYKVYMCLWVAAEARRRGEPRDRQTMDFLATRQGDLWYELLAQAATKRIDLAKLRTAANTGPRQAELAFL